MRFSLPLAGALLACLPAVASASAGGTQFPAPSSGGGMAYGSPSTSRPTIARFSVATRVREGKLPAVRYRIDELGQPTVRVRIAILPLGGKATPQSIPLGSQKTGRTLSVRWPRGMKLTAGRYLVRLHAVDALGRTLVRPAHASGRATLTVLPKPKAKKTPAPAPVPAPAPTPAPAPVAPVPTDAPITPGVFPVAGPHTYGDGIGAPRNGHTHEGQDILAAEGLPVAAPVAGTVSQTTYQAHGAGYYIVMRATDGRDFFFAHCQTNSFAVPQGASVAAGAPLCKVGHTGDASGPHLHFEIWVGGWRTGGHFVDPTPQLRAWDR